MQDFRKSAFCLIMVGAFIGLSLVPLHAQSAGSESANDPLLDTLNNEFRDQYRQALAATLAQAGPVILEEGDNLILIHKGERPSVLVKPVEYHELKAVAHIPLALFVMLSFPQMEMRDLYATATAWQKQLTPAEWSALHMVMIGPHMPRDQECSIQFFERLFREPEEGRRIFYAEAPWNEKDALKLLATHVVDEAAGEAFFGDPMRMHRDLLADAAKAYLDAHPLAP
jgi:hypothetical protein